MNEKPTEEIKKLPIITKFCMTIGNLPTSYLMSLTYLEQVTWLCNYLEKTMIPALNQNAKAVEELQSLFELLRTYVNDYFDNLDVQEEINNKLDQMLEDGVLEQIIEQFLQSSALWCFDNVESMKQATNLINGSFARTLGYYVPNDGGGATYKITNTESQTEYQEELESGLYATLIIENNELYLKTIGIFSTIEQTTYNEKLNKIKTLATSNKNIVLKDSTLTLLDNTSFKGCDIDIDYIYLNNYDLELGGIRKYIIPSNAGNFSNIQRINTISKVDNNDTGNVYIRSAHDYELTINRAYEINFRTNMTDGAIAYSKFNLLFINKINVDPDLLNPDGTSNDTQNSNWMNENVFNINRCTEFNVNEKINSSIHTDFGHNKINGGCFEGTTKILLNYAIGNEFTFERLEVGLNTDDLIKFDTNSLMNTIYTSKYQYAVRVDDKGRQNKVIPQEALNNIKIYEDSVDYKSIIKEIPSNFDVILNSENTGLKLNRNNQSLKKVWESPLFENPQNKMFILRAITMNDSPLPIYYKFYDEDFNEVTDIMYNSINASFYMLTTTPRGYNEMTEGSYIPCRTNYPGAYNVSEPTTMNDGTFANNNYMVFYPSIYWNYTYPNDSDFHKIKYVSFCIQAGTYFHTDDLEFKNIIAEVWELNSIKFRQHDYPQLNS